MLVRAKTKHTQPGTQIYRVEGEEFEHAGKLYHHVEAVKSAPVPVEKPETEALK